MSNIKKLLLAVAVIGASSLASASTLYWQVADSGTEFTYAELFAKDSGGNSYSLDTRLADGVESATDVGTHAAADYTDLGSYGSSDYTFYVELINYSTGEEVKVKSNEDYPWTYTELVNSGYISTGGSAATPAGIAAGGLDGGSVPEPTSGVLLLMGGALLALRRRRC